MGDLWGSTGATWWADVGLAEGGFPPWTLGLTAGGSLKCPHGLFADIPGQAGLVGMSSSSCHC